MITAEYKDSLVVNEKISPKTQLVFFPSLLMLGEGTEYSNNKHHYLVYQLKARLYLLNQWSLVFLVAFSFLCTLLKYLPLTSLP